MLSMLMIIGCADEAPRRSCSLQVWATPSRPDAQLQVIGSWDGWLTPGIPMEAADDPPWRVARIDGDAPPGEHGYLILEDGKHRLDEHNPLTTFWARRSPSG